MQRDAWEIRSHSLLMEEMCGWTGPPSGTAWLVQIEDPSFAQHIVRVDQLSHGRPTDWGMPIRPDDGFPPEPWRPASDEMHEMIEAWDVPDVVPPRHLAVVVVVRRGPCVFRSEDDDWLQAWRYLNSLQRIFTWGLVLVTDEGWADYFSRRSGTHPMVRSRPEVG